MRSGNTLWHSLDYLKLVERAAFHRQIGFKIFLEEQTFSFNNFLMTKFLTKLGNYKLWQQYRKMILQQKF